MIRTALDRRALVLAAAGLVAVALLALTPPVFRDELGEAFVALEDASAGWLWAAGAAFVAAVMCSAFAWRAAFGLSGRADSCARYGVGSLVNSLAPAHVGDAVRLALFAQASPDRRLVTAGKALAGVGATRLACSGILLLGTVRPIALALLAVVPFVGRVPAWVAAATVARLAAAAAVAAAVGVPSPVLTALLVVPAIDLAGLLPITPGNIGVKSGAIALALQAQGVDLTTALSTGIAFHAVETIVGVGFGSASALALSRVPVPRWAIGGATAVLAAALVGTTVVV
jgi:Lysylphosphatidylglycerol synthase TM region